MRKRADFWYYAFGGGLGHVTRTYALARRLIRRYGGRHRILSNTPFACASRQLLATEPSIELALFPSAMTSDNATEVVHRDLRTFAPDWMVVDTFPRGLGGEFARHLLGELPRRILISRHLPAEYVQQFDVESYVASHFERVIEAGESGPFSGLPQTYRTCPFLVRDDVELPDTDWAAQRLRVPANQGAVLLVACGRQEECHRILELACWLRDRWPTDWPPLRVAWPADFSSRDMFDLELRHIPVLELLPAVRLVIGSAGYNTYHEAVTLDVPVLLAGQPRLYDDQGLRATVGFHLEPSTRLLEQITEALRRPFPRPRPTYINGAAQAAELLDSLVEARSEDC